MSGGEVLSMLFVRGRSAQYLLYVYYILIARRTSRARVLRGVFLVLLGCAHGDDGVFIHA